MQRTAQPTSPPGSTVVGVDASSDARRAVAWGLEHARAAGRSLVLVHAIEPLSRDQSLWAVEAGIAVDQIADGNRERGLAVLGEAAAFAAVQCPGVSVITVLSDLDAHRALLEAALTADLLVVGSRGRGPVASELLGSVGVALVRDATCAVAVVRPVGVDPRGRSGVVVGIDEEEHSAVTLATAFRTASELRTRLSVVHCVWDGAASLGWTPMTAADVGYDAAKRRVAEAVHELRASLPDVPVRTVLARGSVQDCLLELASTSDALVVGRHGVPARVHLGPGSLGATLVEHAGTTVLVVP